MIFPTDSLFFRGGGGEAPSSPPGTDGRTGREGRTLKGRNLVQKSAENGTETLFLIRHLKSEVLRRPGPFFTFSKDMSKTDGRCTGFSMRLLCHSSEPSEVSSMKLAGNFPTGLTGL